MAGVFLSISSGEVTLVANTAKSVIQIKSATNQRSKLSKLVVTGKQPAGGTDTPVKCRLTRSSANFGTFSAGLANKLNPTDSETIQSTIGANASVEPTTPTDAGYYFEINPQTGIVDPAIYGQEFHIPGGQSLQLEMTSNGTPIMTVSGILEE